MADPETILRLRLVDGLSLRAIGTTVGLSAERVRQILRQYNVGSGRKPGSGRPRVNSHPNADNRKIDADVVLAVYGCSVDELRTIQDGVCLSEPGSPAYVYRSQRKHFAKSGLWDISLPQWWNLWKVRWPSRSRKRLTLVQRDLTKPLAMGNAEIITHSENMLRYWKRKRTV